MGVNKLYKISYILADVRKKRLEWIGHLVIMDHGRALRKYFRVSWWKVEEWEDLD
jgi:hypothetical protein